MRPKEFTDYLFNVDLIDLTFASRKNALAALSKNKVIDGRSDLSEIQAVMLFYTLIIAPRRFKDGVEFVRNWDDAVVNKLFHMYKNPKTTMRGLELVVFTKCGGIGTYYSDGTFGYIGTGLFENSVHSFKKAVICTGDKLSRIFSTIKYCIKYK